MTNAVINGLKIKYKPSCDSIIVLLTSWNKDASNYFSDRYAPIETDFGLEMPSIKGNWKRYRGRSTMELRLLDDTMDRLYFLIQAEGLLQSYMRTTHRTISIPKSLYYNKR